MTDRSEAATPVRPRIAVVDDDTIIREGLPALLPDLDVVVAARSVEQFLTLARAAGDLDVVVLDLNLNGTGALAEPCHGRRAVAAVAGAGHRCLIYTNERRRLVLAGCLAAGARGLVHKAEPMPRLLDAVHTVRAGGLVLTTAVAGLAEAVTRTGGIPDLTDRQREILRSRARGETFRSIAGRLYITKKTAEDHMSAVAVKLAHYLREHSPADLERELGLGPGDLMS